MRLLLVTVTDGSPQSQAHVDSLLDGLAAHSERCELILVLRGGGPLRHRPAPANVVLHEIGAPLQISLSRARNLALAHARAHGLLKRCTAVAFPDDDCAYPPGTLGRVAAQLSSGTELLCGVYGPSPELVDRSRFPPHPVTVDVGLVMSSASSGTIFLTAPLVAALGDFDERLGLGARFGSAEDSDYMIRALAAGATATYDPDLVVLHPYKAARHGQYFPGNVAVLAKHALGGGRTLVPLLRRLAVGLLLLARGHLRLSSYVSALHAAACMLPAAGALDGAAQEYTRTQSTSMVAGKREAASGLPGQVPPTATLSSR
jgi:hypothetical protein